MLTSRCIRSISRLSSSVRLARRASRLLQGSGSEGLSQQAGLLRGPQTTLGNALATQSKFGRRFTRSLTTTAAACDCMRIPQILAIVEAAGVDTDIADDDDEMSSPVKKGKHWRNLCHF